MPRKPGYRRLSCIAAAGLAAAPLSAYGEGPPVSVVTAEAHPVVEIVRVNGTVTSPQSAVLSPSVAGLIATMQVDAGDRVSAGDVIVTLDRELAGLALERSTAEAAAAGTALNDARRRLAEAERVGPTRAIAESEIKTLRAEVERNQAALEAAEAARREQEARVRRHTVRAPFAGVVSERIADVGEWVSPGDGLVELVATEGLRFDFRVPQRYFGRIETSTDVELEVDAMPDIAIPGRIRAIVPVKDIGARTFLLRVVAATDSGRSVTPGMSAQAALRIDSHRVGVVVPRDALLRYPDGRTTVWRVDDPDGDPVVHEEQVVTGLEFDGYIEIRTGLDAGTMIVTRGNEVLRDGQSVSVR